METSWEQHGRLTLGDDMGTTWNNLYGDDMGTTWRRHGNNMVEV